MSNATITSKEILAKLMATENILIEHANVPTASFDLISRKLILPVWKNISDDVYTLLISHEVGHALYTPTEEWKSAVNFGESNSGSLKTIINIVEDVRIEKMIQAKFPGTIKSFKSGYCELEKSNLFGTQGRDISSYGFLDRINIHFKIGHFGYAKVPFSTEEQAWLSKISSCNTFADVVKISKQLQEYAENKSEDNQESSEQSQNSSSGLNDDSNNSSGESQSDSLDNDSKSNSSGDEQSFDSDTSDSDSSKMDSSSDFNNSDSINENSVDSSHSGVPTNKDLISETQSSFESELQKYVDTNVSETVYANLPKLDLNSIILDYKMVHKEISDYYAKYYPDLYNNSIETAEQFKNSNKSIVNQLANIFEMKKKAKLDVRALTSRTGKLDTNRIYSYRYNDDIFKKHTVVPEGKSHGLVMFLDMSGSMSQNMYGTYEQLLNLVLFCRRVNIPFDVYGFTNSPYSRKTLPPMNFKVGELAFYPDFCLRHYFSSKMSAADLNTAIRNIVCLMAAYKSTGRYGFTSIGVPTGESLAETPIVPTLISATEIVTQFRKKYSLDIVNVIMLSDGDDTHGTQIVSDNGSLKDISKYGTRYRYLRGASNKYFIRDSKTFKQWEIKDSTATCLDILRQVSGVKIIGFHIIQKRDVENKLRTLGVPYENVLSKVASFKENKYCEVTNAEGYDAYYMIPSDKNLRIDNSEFDPVIDTTVDWEDQKQVKKTIKAVAKNFNQFMTQRVTNRVLLNRFIEHIA